MAQGTQLLLLTMFVGPAERDIAPHFDAADRIYARYGISLVAWPFRARPVTAPYQALMQRYEALTRMTGSINHYDQKPGGTVDTLRKWTQVCYPSLVSYMCPVLFCRLSVEGKPGVTFSGTRVGTEFVPYPDAPRSMILLDPDKAEDYMPSLAHEIGHAAGLSEAKGLPHGGHLPLQDNLMWEDERATGSNLMDWQLELIRGCYFARKG